MKLMLVRLIMACIWIVSAYKWGNWKEWKKYYPTMIFFGMGDLIYNVVFAEKRLWGFETDFLVLPINELFIIFTIFFATTLLFLSNFPRKLFLQIMYILIWISIYMAIELFTSSIGMQKNYNGWNIWWSLLHNTIQFPLLILHHKNPICAWIIALIFLAIIMKVFGLPFTVHK